MSEEIEDSLEKLYWSFDSDRSKKTRAERDIFKAKVRFIINQTLETQKEKLKGIAYTFLQEDINYDQMTELLSSMNEGYEGF